MQYLVTNLKNQIALFKHIKPFNNLSQYNTVFNSIDINQLQQQQQQSEKEKEKASQSSQNKASKIKFDSWKFSTITKLKGTLY